MPSACRDSSTCPVVQQRGARACGDHKYFTPFCPNDIWTQTPPNGAVCLGGYRNRDKKADYIDLLSLLSPSVYLESAAVCRQLRCLAADLARMMQEARADDMPVIVSPSGLRISKGTYRTLLIRFRKDTHKKPRLL